MLRTPSMTTLTARCLLTDVGSIEYPVLTLAEDGTLADISSDPLALAQETDTLAATFLDIHTHGALGHDVMSASPAALSEMQRFLARHGVAHYLPTTVTAGIDTTLRALEAIADAIEAVPCGDEARPLGIHLEGPFLAHAKRGVHPTEFLQPPDPALFDRFQAAARGHILLMTVAPEPNAWSATTIGGSSTQQPERNVSGSTGMTALDLIRHATAQGVRCSLGHTNATAAQALAAIAAGAVSATHTFNAMRPLDHREPGVLGVVLDDAQLYAEAICDGVHAEPPLIRLWLKAKGRDRAILITDSMSATGMPDGAYTLGGLPVTVANNRAVLTNDLQAGKETLAGSLLTMDRAVANCQAFTGCTLADAVRFASDNPARMLGRPELTRLAPGSAANLNRFDARGRLVATYLRGEPLR